MKLLLVHSYYQQRGGEEGVFESEAALLRSRGHTVCTYTVQNQDLVHLGPLRQAATVVWNQQVHRELRETIRREAPDLVHFHNTFPRLSPAGYYAAKAERLPVVQTLHNYRLLCLNSLLFRKGAICEECVGRRVPWPGVLHACYRESRSASGAVATLLSVHRAARTWRRMIDVYIALSEFARAKFVEEGLPADRLLVKPNFVEDPGLGRQDGGYVLFVGRLSPEKGISLLLRAWRQLRDIPLKVVGDGPLRAESEAYAREQTLRPAVELLGARPHAEVLALIQRASMLVFPSQCYEGGPRVVVEALACGTPVIGPRQDSLAELVRHGRTGLTFAPGDADDLAAKVQLAWAHPSLRQTLSARARAEYERCYTAARAYAALMRIYRLATLSQARPRAGFHGPAGTSRAVVGASKATRRSRTNGSAVDEQPT